MKKLIVVALGLCMSGCGTPRGMLVWEQYPGQPQTAQVSRDAAECRSVVQKAYPGFISQSDLAQKCMAQRGYRLNVREG